MNLQELGQAFRSERERRGLTIEDVVQKTKISKTNVIALESGDAKTLPHPVYAKGFVRNYARLLGMDPEECATVMSSEFEAEDNVAPQQPESDLPEQEVGTPVRGKSGVLVFLAGILGIVLVGGMVYYMNSKGEEQAAPQPAPAVEESTPEAVEPQAALPEQVEPESVQADPAEEAVQEAAPEAVEPLPEPVPEQEQPVVEEPAQEEAQAPAAAAEPAVQADDRQRVVVSAEEACWLFALVDGGETSEGGVTVDVVLQPGQSKLLRFHTGMVLKLGNAGGVEVTLNGEPYAISAESGQVKTINFSAE